MRRRPPRSYRTYTLFPDKTLFRSGVIQRPAPDEHPYPVIRPRPVCRLAALAAPRAGGAAGRAARRAGRATAVDAAGAHCTARRFRSGGADAGGFAVATAVRPFLPPRPSHTLAGHTRRAGLHTPPGH